RATAHSFGATHMSSAGSCTQAPSSQKSWVHSMPSSHASSWPSQVPSRQTSPSVQGSPSSHALPSPPLWLSQRPRSQTSSGHGSPASQLSFWTHGTQPSTDEPPTHVPDAHVSSAVHSFPSLQLAPSTTGVDGAHVPETRSHASTVQSLRSSQSATDVQAVCACA